MNTNATITTWQRVLGERGDRTAIYDANGIAHAIPCQISPPSSRRMADAMTRGNELMFEVIVRAEPIERCHGYGVIPQPGDRISTIETRRGSTPVISEVISSERDGMSLVIGLGRRVSA